jgi:hypothetical protein
VLDHRSHHHAKHQRRYGKAIRLHGVAEDTKHRDQDHREGIVAGDGERADGAAQQDHRHHRRAGCAQDIACGPVIRIPSGTMMTFAMMKMR